MVIQERRAYDFIKKLIKINTINPPGNETAAVEEIVNYVKEFNLETQIFNITENRSNVMIKLKGKYKKIPPLVFSGHLDTVDIGNIKNWKMKPFSAEETNDKIFGRGSCDMKSGVAGLIEAMIHIKESNVSLNQDVIFIGTAGEEVDCLGAIDVINKNIIDNSVGGIVIAEPSSNQVYSAHKGALWLKVIIHGKTAHGSMPKEGINAINKMNNFLSKLKKMKLFSDKKHELLGGSTLNVGTIKGGVQTNVVPDYCEVTMDIRTTPYDDHESLIAHIKKILNDLNFKNEVIVLNDLTSLSNKKKSTFIDLAINTNSSLFGDTAKQYAQGVTYYTDGSIFRKNLNLDVPIIIYGPGDKNMAHQPNEYVLKSQYINAIRFYINLAKQYSNAYM